MTDRFASPFVLEPEDAHLRILATTDLHSHLVPFDYFNDRPRHGEGLTQTAALIAAAREAAANTLLFDNGDFLQGSGLGDYLARGRTRMRHPMMTAFRMLGYDALCLGNHEFNFGLPFLTRILGEAAQPVLCCNIAYQLGEDPLSDHLVTEGAVVLERDIRVASGGRARLRVGVVGFAPEQVVVWDRQNLQGKVVARPITEAAPAWIAHLQSQKVDLVVALVHSGIGPRLASETDGAFAATAIAGLPGVDLVVAGHSHLAFPGPDHGVGPDIDPAGGLLCGKPAVMPGRYGSHLGVVDLHLRGTGKGTWTVNDHKVSLQATGDLDYTALPAPARDMIRSLETMTMPVHRATRRWIRRPIGETRHALHSYFVLIEDSDTMWTLAEAKAAFVRHALAEGEHAATPVLASVAPIRAGGWTGPDNYIEILPGPLALRHAADLCPFPNTVAALSLTGADLVEWLERSASLYRQVLPGSVDAPLIDETFASFNHDRIYGVSYEIDLSQPPRYDAAGFLADPQSRRIRNLGHGGKPVGGADRFVLATNSFRAGGAGRFSTGESVRQILETRVPTRDMLARRIQELGRLEPAPGQMWKFHITAPTTVTFESSDRARAYLDGHAGPNRIEPMDMTEAGFRRYRVTLVP